MGPLIVLDKSAIQSFSRDEVWMLTKHYLVVLVPILLFEILGDLKKEPREGRLAKEEVVWLSGKLLDSESRLNVTYQMACLASMLGNDPPTGHVLVGGAKTIRSTDGKLATFFHEPKEYQMLRNWRQGLFDEAENLMAEDWRGATAAIDLEAIKRTHAEHLKQITPARDLDEVFQLTDKFLMSEDVGVQKGLIASLLDFIHSPEEQRTKVFARWLDLKMPRLREFSPYSYFCVRILTGFYLGLALGLISTRATNQIDLDYFFYAHFGFVFCSNDKFHRTMAPYVLGEFQSFVVADALKKDLCWLHEEWESLSESEREQRAYDYGSYPPQNPDSITHQLWVKYMRPWEPGSGNRALRMTKEEEAKILEDLKPFMDAIGEG